VGEGRERGRGGESESRMYLCSSCAGSCPDMAMVVLVGGCSISIKQRGVFCIWYICRRKPFSIVLCSYVSLFVRVCVMICGEIYILIFDTLSMVVIMGMYDLSVEVDLYTYI
jgi:hypothetical protein